MGERARECGWRYSVKRWLAWLGTMTAFEACWHGAGLSDAPLLSLGGAFKITLMVAVWYGACNMIGWKWNDADWQP